MIEELLLFAKRCIACMLVMMHLTKAIPVSSNHLAFVGTFASHVGISWCFTTKGMKLGRSQSSVMHSEPSKQSSLLMGKHFWIKNPLQRSNSMNVRNILRPYEGAQTRSLTRRSMQVEESTPSQLGSKKYQVDSAELLPMHEKLRYGERSDGGCLFQ
mmetsp:Transcript_20106/g.66919  ORF Transcript_20106/g.66919 Transcript_20106/m.66919 type:complete len:157 (-) Transcript_20106:5314-5784(-)